MRNLARFYTTTDFDREYLRNNNMSKIGKTCDRKRFLPRLVKDVRWTLVHSLVGHLSWDPDYFGRLYFGP